MRPDAVRHSIDAELAAARRRRGGQPPRVLDVGGGSGVLAVPLAAAGAAVTVVEPNPNALATLSRRAEDAGVADRITAVQADSDALGQVVEAGGADLVLAHGLLEVVDDPKVTVAGMVGALAEDGAVSVLVANRTAALLHRAVAGRLAEASRLAGDPNGRLPAEPLLRRFDTDGLTRLLADAGLVVELLQGQAVLSDLVPGSALQQDSGAAEALADLELRLAGTSPLRDIATRLHAVARRAPGW
ncbi:methyltransferase domain-containing protein [Actinophytocola gossypii]|uniref:Methyltransferase domain-containing protein n=1 Tax=Actinophytocola gossypii TaxID=2812003 RepID=A0ABT2JBI4_9PSEU|nr:methyltransferase domain-containing protein [Actinophytocola gossypii]MCT2585207.1 methyltransferase domain-containing protein [Actinophytocola gossypii]